MKKAATYGLLLTAVWTIITALRIVRYGATSSQLSADTAIVLGAAVWDSKPSPVFAERINHGLLLYESGQVATLLFTGGVGDHDRLAESEVARAYALQRGVPSHDIFIETRSRITYETFFLTLHYFQLLLGQVERC